MLLIIIFTSLYYTTFFIIGLYYLSYFIVILHLLSNRKHGSGGRFVKADPRDKENDDNMIISPKSPWHVDDGPQCNNNSHQYQSSDGSKEHILLKMLMKQSRGQVDDCPEDSHNSHQHQSSDVSKEHILLKMLMKQSPTETEDVSIPSST